MTGIHKRTVPKDLHDPDNHNGVITHPEPDILECEVMWTLGSTAVNKASEGDGISAELFKILKDDAVKVLPQHVSKLENPAVATGLEKVNPHPSSQEGLP